MDATRDIGGTVGSNLGGVHLGAHRFAESSWRSPHGPQDVYSTPFGDPQASSRAMLSRSGRGACVRLAVAMGLVLLTPPVGACEAQVPTLRATPSLRIDGGFSTIQGLAVTRQGTIAAVQTQGYTIALFSSEGKPLGSVGRRGSGPGEFASIATFGSTGDAIWAYDPLLARITWVSAAGSVVRTVKAPSISLLRRHHPGYLRPTPAGIGSGDTMIVTADRRASAGSSPFLTSMGFGGSGVFRLSRDSVFAQLLATTEPTPACVASGPTSAAAIPYCTGALLGVAPNGRGVAVVTFDGPTLSPSHVHSIGARGDTTFSRTLSVPPVRIPGRILDSVLAPLRSDAKYRRQLIPPKYFAPIRQVLAGMDGSVWLEEHTDTDRRQWLILARDGRTVGRLNLPGALRVMLVTVGEFWGVELDEDDVPAVVRYQVR